MLEDANTSHVIEALIFKIGKRIRITLVVMSSTCDAFEASKFLSL